MNRWLYNHSWDDYKKTTAVIGFATDSERRLIARGDKIVYFGNGLVAGIFEAADFVQNQFSGWSEPRPLQVKLNPQNIPSADLVAKPLRYKVSLESPIPGSKNLYLLSEQEFNKIELAILEKKKELIY